MVFAENGVRVHEFTAGDWVLTDEIAVAEADQDDHGSAEGETDGCTDRTSVRQQRVARHDEAAPADHSTEGKCPDAQGTHIFL